MNNSSEFNKYNMNFYDFQAGAELYVKCLCAWYFYLYFDIFITYYTLWL